MTAMPVLLFGHGNPMNAISENEITRGWSAMGASVPRPRAIVSISAHYYIPFSAVTFNLNPVTIHDFGGFPDALYQVSYPAPGDPDLARRIKTLLEPEDIRLDDSWGLDHGTWSVLKHAFPEADIPVVQLSINETRPPEFHYDLGKRLKPLREEGILVVGSGNIVHNLARYAWDGHSADPFDWAVRFEAFVKECLEIGDDDALVHYDKRGQDAALCVPTPDHYLPLLYLLGLRSGGDEVSFPVQGIEGGSISMMSVRLGS